MFAFLKKSCQYNFFCIIFILIVVVITEWRIDMKQFLSLSLMVFLLLLLPGCFCKKECNKHSSKREKRHCGKKRCYTKKKKQSMQKKQREEEMYAPEGEEYEEEYIAPYDEEMTENDMTE